MDWLNDGSGTEIAMRFGIHINKTQTIDGKQYYNLNVPVRAMNVDKWVKGMTVEQSTEGWVVVCCKASDESVPYFLFFWGNYSGPLGTYVLNGETFPCLWVI